MMRSLVVILLSMLVAAYAPIASVTHAQTAADSAKLQQLKKEAIQQIEQRSKSLQQTLDSLGITIAHDTDNGSATTSVTIGESGLKATVVFPNDLKAKSKDFLQKIITELTKMKSKIDSSTSVASVQSLADSIHAQENLEALANVQAAVTQSVQSLTGVFEDLKSTANNLQTQITQLTECTQSITGQSSGNSQDCKGLNTSSSSIVTLAQAELDNIGTTLNTIASLLSSSIALLTGLLSTFNSMLNAIGGINGLSNLSNLVNSNDINRLNTAFSNVDSMLTSFSAITSQIDITSTMSSNTQTLLKDLAGQINL